MYVRGTWFDFFALLLFRVGWHVCTSLVYTLFFLDLAAYFREWRMHMYVIQREHFGSHTYLPVTESTCPSRNASMIRPATYDRCPLSSTLYVGHRSGGQDVCGEGRQADCSFAGRKLQCVVPTWLFTKLRLLEGSGAVAVAGAQGLSRQTTRAILRVHQLDHSVSRDQGIRDRRAPPTITKMRATILARASNPAHNKHHYFSPAQHAKQSWARSQRTWPNPSGIGMSAGTAVVSPSTPLRRGCPARRNVRSRSD